MPDPTQSLPIDLAGLPWDPMTLVGVVLSASAVYWLLRIELIRVRERVTILERSHNGMPEKVASHDRDIEALKEDIQRVESAVRAVDSRIERLADSIQGFRTEIGQTATALRDGQTAQAAAHTQQIARLGETFDRSLDQSVSEIRRLLFEHVENGRKAKE